VIKKSGVSSLAMGSLLIVFIAFERTRNEFRVKVA